MNKQLALLEVPAVSEAVPQPRSTSQDDGTTPGQGEWWKLSREEKQQGLAGVRAIRAILTKSDPNHGISMAKAS